MSGSEHGSTPASSVVAVANPSPEANHDKLTTRAAGFGMVPFNKPQRTIRMECWPRNVDVTSPDAKPYAGWPVTIQQTDNDGRRAAVYSPTLHVNGLEDAVVQVVDESNGEIVYTLRIKGHTFRPKVFRKGSYTVRVGDQDQRTQAFPGIPSTPEGESKELLVKFD